MNETWNKEWDKAVDAFTITRQDKVANVAILEAEAGTGSRYLAVASYVGNAGVRILGGAKLVTLCQPWQATYAVNSEADGLHETYLAEKFCGTNNADKRHGGDMAAVVLTIRAVVRLLDSGVSSEYN